jgi:hypothetical protein
VPNRDLRVSDADRERVVRALERHTAAGRLTLDEFAERVGRVLAAVTHGDLTAVTHDLPTDPHAPTAPVPGTIGDAQPRHLAVAFLLAAITLLVLGVLLAVAR